MKIKIFGASLILFLVNCGGGGGGDGASDSSDLGLTGGWVEIVQPDTENYTTSCNEVVLAGEAFVSATDSRCCSGDVSDTGVNVTWQNLSTGASGDAYQRVIYSALFGQQFIYMHTWSATIPLALGENRIQITARDSSGGGIDNIVTHKPEMSYSISGNISTSDGRGAGYFQSGIKPRLEELGKEAITNSAGAEIGNYKLSCVTPGVYTLTTVSPFNPNPMSPPLRSVTVGGSDVTGQDFNSGTFFVSGRVTWAVSGSPSEFQDVHAVSANGEWTVDTDENGYFQMALPPGNYTIAPPGNCAPTCVFTPDKYDIIVVDSDISSLDFTR